MDLSERGNLFDSEYFNTRFGVPYQRNDYWLSSFARVAENIVRSLKPRRVLDAGCAMGMLVEALRDYGVDAWGIDISSYALSNVRRDMQAYCRAQSLAEPINQRFDLITCIEVLEHMPDEEARLAIRHMTAAADVILFSSTPTNFELEKETSTRHSAAVTQRSRVPRFDRGGRGFESLRRLQKCGRSSVGRAPARHAGGRGIEARRPLQMPVPR